MNYQDDKWFDTVFSSKYHIIRRYAEYLYDKYPWLPSESEDIAQEAFLCLYISRTRITYTDGLTKWLLITANKIFKTNSRKLMRKTAVRHARKRKEPEEVPFLIDENRIDEYISICRNRIGSNNLEILFEYYIDRFPIEGIAAAEGVTVSAMRMRFHRWKKSCIDEIYNANK